MAGIKFKIHPLFYIFGLYYAITGKIFIFLIYTITALVHEMGHFMQAEKLGYSMQKITLMPYGAIITGNISGLKFKDETLLALAGPLLNLVIALFFTAVWWVFPEVYAFTDVVVSANLTLALVNFIPAYPLDGGRILFSVIASKYGENKALKITRGAGFVFCVSLIGLFIYSCFTAINISILFFAIFVLAGLSYKHRESPYIRIFNLSKNRLERGLQIKRYAVSSSTTIKKIINIIDADCYAEITVLDDNGNKKTIFNQNQLLKILETGDLYDRIEKFIV
jgi:stage IV sporulation protein FB